MKLILVVILLVASCKSVHREETASDTKFVSSLRMVAKIFKQSSVAFPTSKQMKVIGELTLNQARALRHVDLEELERVHYVHDTFRAAAKLQTHIGEFAFKIITERWGKKELDELNAFTDYSSFLSKTGGKFLGYTKMGKPLFVTMRDLSDEHLLALKKIGYEGYVRITSIPTEYMTEILSLTPKQFSVLKRHVRESS